TDYGGKWLVLIDTEGFLRVSVNGGYKAGTTILTDGQWHHVAVTLQDDGNPDISEAKLYVDGLLESISSVDGESVNTVSFQNVQLGLCEIQAAYRYFDGRLDDVRIYDRALSAAEIALLGEPLS